MLVAAVSGYAGPAVEQKCQQVGIDAYLREPVDLVRLAGVIAKSQR